MKINIFIQNMAKTHAHKIVHVHTHTHKGSHTHSAYKKHKHTNTHTHIRLRRHGVCVWGGGVKTDLKARTMTERGRERDVHIYSQSTCTHYNNY